MLDNQSDNIRQPTSRNVTNFEINPFSSHRYSGKTLRITYMAINERILPNLDTVGYLKSFCRFLLELFDLIFINIDLIRRVPKKVNNSIRNHLY